MFESIVLKHGISKEEVGRTRRKFLGMKGGGHLQYVYDWVDSGKITSAHFLAFRDFREFSRLDREKDLGLRPGSVFQLDWEWRCAVRKYHDTFRRVVGNYDISMLLFPDLVVGEDFGGKRDFNVRDNYGKGPFSKKQFTALTRLAVFGFIISSAEAAFQQCEVVPTFQRDLIIFHPSNSDCDVKLMLATSVCVADLAVFQCSDRHCGYLAISDCRWGFGGHRLDNIVERDVRCHYQYCSYTIMNIDALGIYKNSSLCLPIDYGAYQSFEAERCDYNWFAMYVAILGVLMSVNIFVYLVIKVIGYYKFKRRMLNYELLV